MWQGQIRYSLIGDYPTQSFFTLDTVTGILTTISSLRLDANYASFYVARVTAIDNLRPNQIATATVAINVIRNQNGPIFSLPSYTNTIPETTSVGTVVLNVTARDLDVNVGWRCDYIAFVFMIMLLKLTFLALWQNVLQMKFFVGMEQVRPF